MGRLMNHDYIRITGGGRHHYLAPPDIDSVNPHSAILEQTVGEASGGKPWITHHAQVVMATPKGGICEESSGGGGGGGFVQCPAPVPEPQRSAPASMATFPSTLNSAQRSNAASSFRPARQTYFGTSAMSSTGKGVCMCVCVCVCVGGGGGGQKGGGIASQGDSIARDRLRATTTGCNARMMQQQQPCSIVDGAAAAAAAARGGGGGHPTHLCCQA